MHLRIAALHHGVWQVQLSYQARAGLEMLVPRYIRQGVIGSADRALEKYHAERGLENLLMVGIAIQSFAKLRDGRVAMSHDVTVDLLPLQPLCRFQMNGGDAQAAMQVAFI